MTDKLLFSRRCSSRNKNLSRYFEKEPYGFFYGSERNNQYLSTRFLVLLTDEATVDLFSSRLIALGFIGSTDGVCDSWRGFDLYTANEILVSYRLKQGYQKFHQAATAMKEVFDEYGIKIYICFDPRASVAIGNFEQMVKALSLMTRQSGHFVSDEHLRPLVLRAAVVAQDKIQEDQDHVYNKKYLPVRREFLKLYEAVKRLEEDMARRNQLKALVDLRVSQFKAGIWKQPVLKPMAEETVVAEDEEVSEIGQDTQDALDSLMRSED